MTYNENTVNSEYLDLSFKNNIATLYKEVGKNNRAIRYYHKALDIKKNYSEALFNLSILQLYFNQFQEGWYNYGKSFSVC